VGEQGDALSCTPACALPDRGNEKLDCSIHWARCSPRLAECRVPWELSLVGKLILKGKKKRSEVPNCTYRRSGLGKCVQYVRGMRRA